MWGKMSSSHLICKKFLPSFYSSTLFNVPKNKIPYFSPNKITRKFFCSSKLKLNANTRKEEIVIVGGGISGLATALGLHRLGIRSLVLEQSDSLRTGGASIALSKNAWNALDLLGVGNELKSQFLEIQGITIKTSEGKVLQSYKFKDKDKSQEIRGVERKILLQTLADQLPTDSIQFSSKLSNIDKDDETGETLLEFVNGDQLSAKIVIGCDGIWSQVAKWMGFSDPKYAGHIGLRGLAIYPNGHPYQPFVSYTFGRGVRGGFVPISSTKLYWFAIYNSATPGPKVTDPYELKQLSLDLVKDWQTDLPDIIDHTPEDAFTRSPLYDRWLWPRLTPSASKGGVVLVGDAWHPMTPNLGQGGCNALEDAVLLAEKLGEAMKSEQRSIEDAFRSYEDERWSQVFTLTVRSYFAGVVMQATNPVVHSLKNHLIPWLYKV